MEIYFIQHCQLILQDSRLITIVPNQCTLLVSSPGKDGIVLTDLGSWWNTGKCWSCWWWWWWWGSSYLILFSRVWVRPCHWELFVPPVAELTWNAIGNLYQVRWVFRTEEGRGGWWVVTDRGPAPPGLITFSPPGTINQTRFCQQSGPGRHNRHNYLLSSFILYSVRKKTL